MILPYRCRLFTYKVLVRLFYDDNNVIKSFDLYVVVRQQLWTQDDFYFKMTPHMFFLYSYRWRSFRLKAQKFGGMIKYECVCWNERRNNNIVGRFATRGFGWVVAGVVLFINGRVLAQVREGAGATTPSKSLSTTPSIGSIQRMDRRLKECVGVITSWDWLARVLFSTR